MLHWQVNTFHVGAAIAACELRGQWQQALLHLHVMKETLGVRLLFLSVSFLAWPFITTIVTTSSNLLLQNWRV